MSQGQHARLLVADRAARRPAARRRGQLLRLDQPRRPQPGRRGQGLLEHRRRSTPSRRQPARRLRHRGRRRRPALRGRRRRRRLRRRARARRRPDLRGTPRGVAAERRPSTAGAADVGAGHGHQLHFHGHSPVHRAPAHLKIVALVAFMLLVVARPRGWWPAFVGVRCWCSSASSPRARCPPAYLLKRMVVEVPFVVFALLMPFVATGPQVEVLGLSVSRSGLWPPPERSSSRARSASSPASTAGRHHRAAGPAGRPRAAARRRRCSCRSWPS